MNGCVASATLAFFALDPAGAASQQCEPDQTRLTPSNPRNGDEVGRRVALDGETAVLGAPSRDTANGSNAGAAFVFVRAAGVWTQQAVLTASDGAAGDVFGLYVAIDGNTIVVGAEDEDHGGMSGVGAAYVFVRSCSTWAQQAKLTASDGAAGDRFGSSVSLQGDQLLVGAQGSQWSGVARAGAAYVFTRGGTAWTQRAKFGPSDPATYMEFGAAAALDGDTALVGAPATGSGGSRSAAYFFEGSGASWTERARVTAPVFEQHTRLGVWVEVDGDTAVAGADLRRSGRGGAFVYGRSAGAWTQVAELDAFDKPWEPQWFGNSVALSGDLLIVGAPMKRGGGCTYSFRRSAGVWEPWLFWDSGAPQSSEGCGHSVALDGSFAVSGAPNARVGGVSSGVAYAFDFPSMNVSYCTPSTTTHGCTPTIRSSGCASATALTGFTLSVTDVEGQRAGVIFYGLGPAAVLWEFGSTSLMCVAPPAQRMVLLSSGGTAGQCDGMLAIDWNAWRAASTGIVGEPFAPGQELYAQGWFRDPGAAKNTNLSDGVRFTLEP